MKLDRMTYETMASIVTYDPDTGIFYKKGTDQIISRARPDGYHAIHIYNKTYELAHRVALLLMNGRYPDGEVDHINGIRSDNRWCNLREVTKAYNQWNAKMRSDNVSGIKGVNWVERDKAWVARIQVNGKRLIIGYFKDLEIAKIAITKARETYHREFAFDGVDR